MQIKTPGEYRLTMDYRTSNLTTVATIPANTVFKVTQVCDTYKKFYSPTMLDWHNWEVPAEPVSNDDINEKGEEV